MGYLMPAEFEPQKAVWMLWPYRNDVWREDAIPMQKAFARVAMAISMSTPVFIGVPVQYWERAQFIIPKHINLVAIESDDCWVRDTGPTIVKNQETGDLKALDWQFNAWGGNVSGLYKSWARDELVATAISKYHNIPVEHESIILEGGAIHVDGEGTCITTEECLLSPCRNKNISKKDIELILKDKIGVSKIIWLKRGVFNDETCGHVDNMCCFIRPGEVVLHWSDDKTDPQYERSLEALNILENTTDAKGRNLIVHKLPAPTPIYMTEEEANGVVISNNSIERKAGNRLAASYVNFLITNERVVMPLLDPTMDNKVLEYMQSLFPDKEVYGVEAREILLGGGNIHCLTQQIPK